MQLALVTGIPPSVWADEGEQAIVTALVILEEQEKAAGKGRSAEPGAGGPIYSG